MRGSSPRREQLWCFGDFAVGSTLHEDSRGAVSAATVRRTGRCVVLKKRTGTARERAEREWAFFQHLPEHEHLIQCLGSFTAFGGSRFVVLDRAKGGDLHKLIAARAARSDPLAEDAIWGIFRAVVRGVEFLQQWGVCHGDIKPANILLHAAFAEGDAAIVKLCDLDAAQWISDPLAAPVVASGGSAGNIFGSLTYAAPEVIAQFCQHTRCPFPERTRPILSNLSQDRLIANARQSIGKIDVWSLGALLFELAALRPAFAAARRQELFEEIVNVDPLPSLGGAGGAGGNVASKEDVCEVPAWSRTLNGVIARLLVRDPLKRPSVGGIVRWFEDDYDPPAAATVRSKGEVDTDASTDKKVEGLALLAGREWRVVGKRVAMPIKSTAEPTAAARDGSAIDAKEPNARDAALRRRARRIASSQSQALGAADAAVGARHERRAHQPPDVRLRLMTEQNIDRLTIEGTEIALRKLSETADGAAEFDPISMRWKRIKAKFDK